MPWRVSAFLLHSGHEPTLCSRCAAAPATHQAIARSYDTDAPEQVRSAILCPACLALAQAPGASPATADQAPAALDVVPAPSHTYPIPERARLATCRYCGAAVYWIVTPASARCPVDPYAPHRGRSHYLTCTNLPHAKKAQAPT